MPKIKSQKTQTPVITKPSLERKLKIGIALGSGGAKGLAHIGVLKVLKKYGIELDMIAGTSMGAVIGAAYATGMPVEEIEALARRFFSSSSVFSVHNFHFFQESLIRPDDIKKSFYAFVGEKRFEDCKIKFVSVGIDLESGQEILLSKGKLLDSIEASSAYPGVFPPVFVDGHYMVDGGLLNPTPVNYLREENMDVIVGVHLSNLSTKQFISGMVFDKYYKKPEGMLKKHGVLERARLNMTLMIQVLMRSVEVAQKLNSKIVFLSSHPDLIVKPYTEDIGAFQFERIEEAIKSGEDAMEKEMPNLLQIIEMKKKDVI